MIKFTTKRDANGNRYTLLVDMDSMTVKRDYNTSHNYDDYITISKKDREKLYNELIELGFKTI